ncbi:hypothetical protein M8C21_004047 [Ambrosia artemisiifolia]|uniref:Uncharacterized protein n=1 Tax=Ambrosia artemisiifolia TaxID=4212 RepID=A0AAD5CBX4_AMBAR|nr:hypothetical protein M8C21_004047 [Ambrosia artemisiifolia]
MGWLGVWSTLLHHSKDQFSWLVLKFISESIVGVIEKATSSFYPL